MRPRGKPQPGRKGRGAGRGQERATRRSHEMDERIPSRKTRKPPAKESTSAPPRRPPPVPDDVAAAETVIAEPGRPPVTKRRPAGGAPPLPVRKQRPLQTKDTAVDEMDLLPDPAPRREEQTQETFVVDGGRGRREKTRSRTKRPQAPAEAPGEDDDVLEPIEGEEDAAPVERGTSTLDFVGSGLGLGVILAARGLFALLAAAGIALSGAAAVWTGLLPEDIAARVPAELLQALGEAKAQVPQSALGALDPFWIPAAAGAVFLLLALALGRSVRSFRVRHTRVFGEPVYYRAGIVGSLFQATGNAVIFLATAGLASPWIAAWNRRFEKQHSFTKARRREKNLDFKGSGGQALTWFLLAGVTFPLVFLSLGIYGSWLRLRWIRWEQDHLLVPSPTGRGSCGARFGGSLGGLLKVDLLGGFLTLLTGGLARPWARTARWRWIARQTEILPPEEGSRRTARLRA